MVAPGDIAPAELDLVLLTHDNHRDAPDVSSIAGLTLAEDFATYEY